MSSSDSGSSVPHASIGSPGSSVSSALQEEYDELLRHAVVVPNFDGRQPLDIQAASASAACPPSARRSPAAVVTVNERAKRSPLLDDSESERSSESASSDSNMAIPLSQPNQHALSSFRASPQVSTPVSVHNGSNNGFTLSSTHPLAQPLRQANLEHSVSSELPEEGDDEFDEVLSRRVPSMSKVFRQEEEAEQEGSHDEDMLRLEGHLDSWCADLKRSVLAEFGQTKMRLIQMLRLEQNMERERHAAQSARLHREIDELRQLAATYEDSIQHKDHIISNLSASIQKMRDRMELQRSFASWKMRHCDEKRETFTAQLARQHYERLLKRKIYRAWHAILENKWRQRVERACQVRAQEVCAKLAEGYEQKLTQANNTLQEAQAQVVGLQSERSQFEESMKRAFMRGVCALNMEAMGMFHEQPNAHGTSSGDSNPSAATIPHQGEMERAPVVHVAPERQEYGLVLGSGQNRQRGQTDRSATSTTRVVGAQPAVPAERKADGQRPTSAQGKQNGIQHGSRTATRGLLPPVAHGNPQRVAVRVERHAPAQPQATHTLDGSIRTATNSQSEGKVRPVATTLPIKLVE